MDAGRFDALSRSFAERRSRRFALKGLGLAGVAAAFGAEHAPAASGTCALHIFAKTSAGPHKNKTYSGTLNLEISDGGAIDAGTFDLDDGKSFNLVGQATGRALNLRVKLGANEILELNGTADIDLLLCRGDASGVFGGPSDTDIGTWRTGNGGSSGTTSGGGGSTNSGGSTSGGSTSGGSTSGGSSNSGGGGSTNTGSGGGGSTGGNSSGGGGGSTCASGVVCNGVCCEPPAGLTPDSMVCNAGACECSYSCAAAGCPGNASGTIVNTCGSDPQPHCHSECNAPADNGCGDMTCGDGETLNVDNCTCMSNGGGGAGDCGGADLLHDATNCGFCGVVCGSGFCQNGVCADADPCPATGRTNCNSLCMDTQNDPENCGGCGIHCPSGQCIQGGCTDVVN